jgi:predicted nucleic acid-binding protein
MRGGFLVDTNVISEFNRQAQAPDANVEAWLNSTDPLMIYTSVLVCGEIQKGIDQLDRGKRRNHLEQWIQKDLFDWLGSRILPIDYQICILWGHLTEAGRTKGVQLPVIDGLIAATALHNGLTVATRNTRHFANIGVDVIDPWNFAPSR